MQVPDLSASAARARSNPAEEPEAPGDQNLAEHIEGSQPAEAPADPGLPADTAFILYLSPDGQAEITPDLNARIARRRLPTSHDVIGICTNIADASRGQQDARIFMDMMGQVQQQAMRQMQDQTLAAAIEYHRQNGAWPPGFNPPPGM